MLSSCGRPATCRTSAAAHPHLPGPAVGVRVGLGGGSMRLKRSAPGIVLVLAVAVGAATGPASVGSLASDTRTMQPRGARSNAAFFRVVNISGTSYGVVNLPTAIGLLSSPFAKFVSRVLGVCRADGEWGFVSTSLARPGVGAVAWVPANPLDCAHLPVGGGGPDSHESEPCFQVFKSNNPRDYVLITGSNTTICTHLSTQV